MPHIVFTTTEVVISLVEQMRDASARILELSDLEKKPLDPGESPDARRHKIAKLGKRLAEAFQSFDVVMNAAASHAEGDPAPEAADPGCPQVN